MQNQKNKKFDNEDNMSLIFPLKDMDESLRMLVAVSDDENYFEVGFNKAPPKGSLVTMVNEKDQRMANMTKAIVLSLLHNKREIIFLKNEMEQVKNREKVLTKQVQSLTEENEKYKIDLSNQLMFNEDIRNRLSILEEEKQRENRKKDKTKDFLSKRFGSSPSRT
jgi:hypothetical protein